MLHLIKQWLVAPVEETDERGRTATTTQQGRGARHAARGADLAVAGNLYMRRFVLGWKTLGHEQRLQARIVNYADDFVICCRRAGPRRPWTRCGDMMERLKLTVNETKTHVCRLPDESFDFLGYTFGRCYSPRTGGAYLGAPTVEEEASAALPSGSTRTTESADGSGWRGRAGRQA